MFDANFLVKVFHMENVKGSVYVLYCSNSQLYDVIRFGGIHLGLVMSNIVVCYGFQCIRAKQFVIEHPFILIWFTYRSWLVYLPRDFCWIWLWLTFILLLFVFLILWNIVWSFLYQFRISSTSISYNFMLVFNFII